MLQRYKLRLGDGTVLGVDHEGLRTWAIDGKAMVQAADSHHWYPLKEFLAAEYVAARRIARQKAKGREPMPVLIPKALPLVYPQPRGEKAPPPPADLPPFIAGPAEETPFVPLVEEAPFVPVQAEVSAELFQPETLLAAAAMAEPIVAQPMLEDPVAEPLPVETAEATLDEESESKWIPDDGKAALPPAFDARDDVPEFHSLPTTDQAEPVFIDTPSLVQALADEPTPPPREFEAPPSSQGDAAPWIAPKALEDLEPARPVSRPVPPPLPSAPPAPPPISPRQSLQVLADDLVPSGGRGDKEAWRPGDDLPIIPLKPLDDELPAPPRLEAQEKSRAAQDEAPARSELEATLLRWCARGYAAYDALLTGWIQRLARPKSTERDALPSHPQSRLEDLAPQPLALKSAPPPAREPLTAPPPIRDLPVLRLADIPEPAEEGDIYETEGALLVAWRWTKRIAVTLVLLAGGVLAVVSWQSWAPGAERLGQAVLTRIDRAKLSRDQSERQRQALQEATERLPHLAPQTILLLMAQSPTDISDVPELFRAASDAADRGAVALTPQEAQELKGLRAEVLKALRSSERGRVDQYDAARARRLVFPFESVDVLELFGRGAYALPPPSRERLQDLLAKAVAAGLEGSSEVSAGSLAEP
jgi:hypothetical protein